MHLPGKAVQVDPNKPTLNAPKTKRLKLTYDELLSSFAFKFNLRHYNLESDAAGANATDRNYWVHYRMAGAYTRPLFGST